MSAPLPLDDQLCFSLYAASMAITRTYKPLLDQLSITYPQYLVLHTLWEQDGRTVGEIADRLGLVSSNVTPLAKRLEAAGLVSKARHPEDDRQIQVFLTQSGSEIRYRCGCLGEALLARSGMSLENLFTLNQQVQAFRDALWKNRQEAEGSLSA